MKSFINFISEELVKDGPQLGSNEGGVYKDSITNKKYYVKHYKNSDQAKVEALTGKIYKHMGIHTIDPQYREINGKPSISTEWNDKLSSVKPKEFEKLNSQQAEHIAKMYHGAILTKNWDIVGLEHDNIMKHKDHGHMISVDHGGSFHFRARGSHKDYGDDINEKETLKNNKDASGHVFSTVLNQHPDAEKKSLDNVKRIDDNHIHGLFKHSGLNNWQELHDNFKKRKYKLLNSYE